MRLADIIIISFNGINERRFRFALNLLGILIGCAAITGLISVTQSMNDSISDQLEILGVDTLFILPGGTGEDSYIPTAAIVTSPKTLSRRDKTVIESLPEVRSVSVMQQQYCTYTLRGEAHLTQVYGIDYTLFEINNNYDVSEGRAFTRNDKNAVIIGSKVAQPDGEPEPLLRVGDRMALKTFGVDPEVEMTFRVVGIMKSSGGMEQMNPDSMILIPIRICEQMFESSGVYNVFQAKVSPNENLGAIADKIKDDVEDAIVITPESIRDTVTSILSLIEDVLLGVATISLIVAGVGIINTMTISVNERTKEIGTLKAIGAKNIDVMFLFLFESSYTGLIGGILGGVLGFLLGKGIGSYIGLPINTSFQLMLFVMGFAMFTSIIAGAYPAWQASKLNPVEALRNE